MRRLALALVLTACSALAQHAIGVRILFGVGGKIGDQWNGKVQAEGARIASVEPWRFDDGDEMLSDHGWKAAIHDDRNSNPQQQPNAATNGVLVFLDSANPDATLAVHTAQGDFRLALRDVAFGSFKMELDGKAMADKIPGYQQLTNSPEEQDFPVAATGKDGSLWIAYLEFKHSPDYVKVRLPITKDTEPKNFDRYLERPGGDQVFARRYAHGEWGEPIAVTAPGGDMWRPAIAVDGKGRAWVFWSANKISTYDGKGVANYDVFARVIEGASPGKTVQISNDLGNDVDAVAASDSKGNVWVAWQGWRNGRAAIFSARQQGEAFTAAEAVSGSKANEWNPAIAADSNGRVSVAWDSYRHGNYDIYLRTASAGRAWGKEVPAAASARYEAYPSLAYDASGRLWIAYEEGDERWGKDFGAYDTTGISVYQGRAVRMRGLEPDGRWVAPSVDPGTVLTGNRLDRAGAQNDHEDWFKLDPDIAKTRGPNKFLTNKQAPRNTTPRLLADASGRVWLAYRTREPGWSQPAIGSIWTELLSSWDGTAWSRPIYLHHSDNLLDNRPALASLKGGELMVIGSSDHRRALPPMKKGESPFHFFSIDTGTDPYNNDLFVNTISLAPANGQLSVKPVEAPSVAPTDPLVAKERDAIAAMRAARTPEGLRVLRGEFHRHSEISPDGGADGSILDQFRYAIDTGGLDWVGCCDHDNGQGREYTWWLTQKLTDIYRGTAFTPMFSYERTVQYPEGHRNVIFAQRGVRTLPRLPKVAPDSAGHAPDTQMLYRYLRQHDGIVASHTSATSMGTDWRDNDPLLEPIVEIYQGERQNYEMPGAPRANSESDSIQGWEPKGFVSHAFELGYKLSFQASSDHVSTHLSYCNILARDTTREGLLDAIKARHVYGATDNILADFRAGSHIMGDAFEAPSAPEMKVRLQGTADFKKVYIVKNNQYVYTLDPGKRDVSFTWRDSQAAKGTSYYYVRGEQADGNIVWVSPMWVTY